MNRLTRAIEMLAHAETSLIDAATPPVNPNHFRGCRLHVSHCKEELDAATAEDTANDAAALPTVTGSDVYDLIGFMIACDIDELSPAQAAELISAKMVCAQTRQAYRAAIIASLEQLHNGYNLEITRYATAVLTCIL